MLRKAEPHVVIVGGGFGGLAAARRLARARVRVTLIDRSNHHLFQPLLYQVATAALAAPDIAAPIRGLLRRQANATVLMAEVTRIDAEKKRLVLENGAEVEYDYLILATGMGHAYFGHDDWAEHAPGLKTLGEALAVRSRILRGFELAERETDDEKRRAHTTFVIIGAGPTGVELAGAIAEIAGRTLARDFRRFDPTTTRVILVEAGDRILPTFEPVSSAKAAKSLAALGIEIRTQTRVTSVHRGGVKIGDEEIEATTVLWAAGVRASGLTAGLGAPMDRIGRVKTEPDLGCPGRPEVFVVGDLVAMDQDGKPLPGVCQMAMQGGAAAAANVLALIEGRPTAAFRYHDKGSMATIGRARAVAEVGRARFAGFFAWFLWLFVHILFLVDFRNRLFVLFEWAWHYLTWSRSSRVILEAPASDPPPRPSLVP